MMNKKIVSLSFTSFASGFAFALYGLFILRATSAGWQLGVFRTLGQNPLAAYIIHHMVGEVMPQVVPRDSPFGWALVALVIFFSITYLFVRYLERQALCIRL